MADLQSDFPGFAALEQAGITTQEQVQSMSRDELLALDGIGEATATKIMEAQAPAPPEATPQGAPSSMDRLNIPQPQVEARPQDETVPGGRYKIGDIFVNANGDAI